MRIVEQCRSLVNDIVKFARDTNLNLPDAEDFFRYTYVKTIVTDCHGNRSNAARVLGIHRNTLMRVIGEMRGKGYEVMPGTPGNRKRQRSLVDHRGIALRKAHWREQQ